ncbi:hypothetical protein DM02DRAFT_221320 [Periconia macrospinosa]|uniref:Uncharacterized protein n=1 Tax=Periconia macrospinosa TaxID=97972 RepID=A0A2V1D694_9PLEO|nr:hypothetical protein DM02DRAFT_221320 [Periconia macrospinosa]
MIQGTGITKSASLTRFLARSCKRDSDHLLLELRHDINLIFCRPFNIVLDAHPHPLPALTFESQDSSTIRSKLFIIRRQLNLRFLTHNDKVKTSGAFYHHVRKSNSICPTKHPQRSRWARRFCSICQWRNSS